MHIKHEYKTSSDWVDVFSVVVTDPIGWKEDEIAFGDKISFDEFFLLLLRSKFHTKPGTSSIMFS